MDEHTTSLVKVLTEISMKMDRLIEYIDSAEREVPEYLRRHTMYLHDLIHIKWSMEQAGLNVDQAHAQEIDRAFARLGQCVENERNQGGAFHKHLADLTKEGLLDMDGRKRDYQK